MRKDKTLKETKVLLNKTETTIFRKVLVKERLPEIDLLYKIFDTDKGRLWFIRTVKVFSQSFDERTIDFFKDVEWWLEEIELPSDEDIISEAEKRYPIHLPDWKYNSEGGHFDEMRLNVFIIAGKWIRDVLAGPQK